MRKSLFAKLAFTNLKKQYRAYIPYMLACIGSIMMFYNFCQLTFDKGTGGGSLKFVMSLGVYVIALFSIIFLFYTNSFLIKRRTKEFGLYNMLGMEKKHIARVIALECLYTSLTSLILGLTLGVLINKLMVLALMKLLNFNVRYGFTISTQSLIITIILFTAIFVMTLLRNLFQITRAKPVDLLHGGNVGEKEPKTKWIMAVLGVICLGVGYYISLTTKSPMAALLMFFLAVILVIIGTYFLFTAGSIAALKLLKKNKRYYYQTRHFTTVSGMLYRMKQNAAGLASICILSTMVLVMLSSTTCLYFGMEDALHTRYPRNIVFTANDASDTDIAAIDAAAEAAVKEHGVTMESPILYRSVSLTLVEETPGSLSGRHDEYYLDSMAVSNGIVVVKILPLEEYERATGDQDTLAPGECLLYSDHGMKGSFTELALGENTLTIKRVIDKLDLFGADTAMMIDHYYLIVDNRETARALYESLRNDKDRDMKGMDYYLGFNVSCDAETQIAVGSSLRKAMQEYRLDNFYVETMEGNRADFIELYGGLFFLGIFLGLLFIMATVMIIYYKQISEGYDDHERFQIMQKVGMSKLEVRRTIKSQVLTVFFLPLITAAVHLAMSFNVISRLFLALNLHNDPLFALCAACSLMLFALLYTLVYLITARSYYKIVEAK